MDGNYHYYSEGGNAHSSHNFDTIVAMQRSNAFLIDTTIPGSIYSIAGDSMVFSLYKGGYNYRAAVLHFDTSRSMITAMNVEWESAYNDSEWESQYGTLEPVFHHSQTELACRNIEYTQDSILSTQLFSSNLDTLGDSWFYFDSPSMGSYSTLVEDDLISGTASVRGAFQPPAGVRIRSAQPALTITRNAGIVKCAFAPSSNERMLRIFSTIGSEVTSFSISLGSVYTFLPHLRPGLYFLEFDNTIIKLQAF